MFGKVKNFFKKYAKSVTFGLVPVLSLAIANNVYADSSSGASIDDMLGIFSKLLAWILKEGATLLNWMLDKPILMISMGLFFVGAVIAFLMRIYHSV